MDAPLPKPPPGGPPDEDWLLGQLVDGKYRIESLIASGGMGRVYKGTQEPLGRPVAVKILAPVNPGTSGAEVHEKRFFREASIASRLSHPNTVVIHDYGALPEARGLFLVMEYIPGASLYQVIADKGPLPAARTLRIARQICGSLAEAHGQGVVHRDLKPLNILLTSHGGGGDFVKVVDFGLVKSVDEDAADIVTQEGQIIGSPLYMSPEQIFSQDVDARTDVYAFGVILYEMLTGRPPFVRTSKRRDHSEVIRGHLTLPPPPMRSVLPVADVAIPQALQQLVMECLAKAPDDRPPTMQALDQRLAAIEAARTAAPPAAAPPPRPAPLPETTTSFSMDRVLASVPVPQHLQTEAAPSPVRPTSAPPRGRWVALALAAAAAAGLAFVFWPSSTPKPAAPPPKVQAAATAPPVDAPPAAAPPTASAQVAAEVADDRAPPPPSPNVLVRFETDPPGATLRAVDDAADTVLGTTPLTLEVPRAPLADAPRTWVAQLPGHVNATMTLAATDQAEVTLRQRLSPADVAPLPPAPEQPAATPAPLAADAPPQAPAPKRPAPPRKKSPAKPPLDIKLDR